MQEVRCTECNKLLLKIHDETKIGLFECKCPRCGHMNTNKGECQE
jgi:phage FluMu protein Com